MKNFHQLSNFNAADFVNLQILPFLLKGVKVGDITVILGSIDIIMGSVDR